MDVSLAIGLAVTLVIALWLVIKNDQPNERVRFDKMLALVNFPKEDIADEADLNSRIEQLHIQEYASAIQQQALPDVRFRFMPAIESEIPIGVSKLGGSPDVSEAMTQSMPGLFLAQINCSECSHSLLPKEGMLYFFLDAEALMQNNTCMVHCIYEPQALNLHRAELMQNEGVCKTAQIMFFPALSLPEYESEWVSATFTDYKINAYYKLCNVNQCSKMMGYPMGITQHFDMDNHAKTLLLQLDSDDALNMMWGHNGRLYVFIDTAALKALDFSNVYTYIQDYK